MSSFWYNPLSSAFFKFSILYLFMTPLTLFMLASKKLYMIHWHLFTLNISYVTFPIILDIPGTLTATTVLFISANVMKFAKLYMKSDIFMNRFSSLIILFVLSMNLLIFLPSLPMILLGWDGLGITSFLLIIYYQNSKSLSAGMITALTNRIGDTTILMAIALMMSNNQWNYSHMWHNSFFFSVSILLLIASLTKSAQMPFSSWLPAAMAAPTPVSALVHSSTLVTAGIFLQIRFADFIFSCPKINFMVLFISAMTMFMSGLSATMEYDMKKIIALSTLSQLSVMMTSLALNFPTIALFHLVTHAMFKALMFICAGMFINSHSHNQDIRLMMNLNLQAPLTSSCFMVANLSLCAIPFMAGFYSKDLIIEMLLSSPMNMISLIFIIMALGATTAYSTRLMMNCLWKPSNAPPLNKIYDDAPDSFQPTFILTLAAICLGSILNWLLLPQLSPINLPIYLKLLALFILILSFILCWNLNLSLSSSKTHQTGKKILFEMSSSMWFLTPLSSQFFLKTLNLSHKYLKTLDQGWMESMSAQGIHQVLSFYSKSAQPFQANIINIYLHISFIILIPIIFLF